MYRNNQIAIKQGHITLGSNTFNLISADFGSFIGVIIVSNRKVMFQKQHFPGTKKSMYGIPTVHVGSSQSIKSALNAYLKTLYGQKTPHSQKLYSSYMAHFFSPSKIHYYVVNAPLPKGNGLRYHSIEQLLEMIRTGRIRHGPSIAGLLLYCALSQRR